MRKFTALLFAVACALVAFAALDFNEGRSFVALEPQSVSAGATNSATIAVTPLKGNCAVVVVANAAASRSSLDFTLWKTNTVDGGWSVVAERTFTNKTAIAERVPFVGEYMSGTIKVGVGSIGAASVVSAAVLTY